MKLTRLVEIHGKTRQLQVNEDRLRYAADADPDQETTLDAVFSAQRTGEGRYSILIEGRHYLVAVDGAGAVSVNGFLLDMRVIDPRDLASGGEGGAAGGRAEIAAQMPGKVIRVLVEPGQTIEAGQGLIVLEAMKMQNEMKAPQPGVVAAVKASAGDTVAAGQVLVTIDPLPD